jgi:hypothetical protein
MTRPTHMYKPTEKNVTVCSGGRSTFQEKRRIRHFFFNRFFDHLRFGIGAKSRK